MNNEAELLAACAALERGHGAPDVLAAIARGEDPLGDAFCRLRSPRTRRQRGAVYTPLSLVQTMIDWCAATLEAPPARVVDPGTGSARFLLAAGRRFGQAELVGIEVDEVAATVARAHLRAAGLETRARVLVADYARVELPPTNGVTLFVGNPPYVRHHDLGREQKEWLTTTCLRLGLPARQLSGLHAHFFLATLVHARPGDVGCFLTSAEWLDTRYGELVRALLRGPLGLVHLERFAATARVFADAFTTAVITGFRIGDSADAFEIEKNQHVPRAALQSSRWSEVGRRKPEAAAGTIELGEVFRVHRGQVTGCNRVWIASPDSPPLPASYLKPTITRAQELFAAAAGLTSDTALKRVIDLPVVPIGLDTISDQDKLAIETFLAWARDRGAADNYIARHRKPWWAVKLFPPAPIIASYMARRPPVFVRNLCAVHHLNIAHGLYPRSDLPVSYLDTVATYLSTHVELSQGRTYAGGLVKFEPSEMSRLRIPKP